jgi:hypothetical protein
VAHRHHEWFKALSLSIQDDWDRLHAAALKDPQKAGHGGEATWAQLLNAWLPDAYAVGTRKYILPEDDTDPFETDIVIFNPGYPQALRDREEVLAGGIAAAFSVKLTLNSEGIRDAFKRAVQLRRHLKPRGLTAREEILAPFPVGLVAHSHAWKAAGSKPIENVSNACWKLDQEYVQHPRETLDLLCVADLATWATARIPWMPPDVAARSQNASVSQKEQGFCSTTMIQYVSGLSPAPVGVFVANLLMRLSYADPTLRPMAEGLLRTETTGAGGGPTRQWDLDEVFSESVIWHLAHKTRAEPDWANLYLC